MRNYDRALRERSGAKVRKPRLPVGAPPQQHKSAPEKIDAFLDVACIGADDKARYRAYTIRNELTGQHYVGITERVLRARLKQHLADAMKGKGYMVHAAIHHDGLENFTFQYVAAARSRGDLNKLEQQLVAQYAAVENGYNQTRGGSASEAVGKPVSIAGRRFISLNSAARDYGVAEASVHQRVKRYGWTLEQALAIEPAPPVKRSGKSIAIVGRKFPSLRAACAYYGITESVAHSRLAHGWSLEQTLGLAAQPSKGRNSGKSILVRGIRYNNISLAAKAHNLRAAVVASRIRKGWSTEQALGLVPPKPRRTSGKLITVAGVEYESISEACRRLAKVKPVVQSRLLLGWTAEQAFDFVPPPPPSGEKNGKAITVAGVTYSSRAKAAVAHGLDPRIVHKRLTKLGWSKEQAFGLVAPPKPKPV